MSTSITYQVQQRDRFGWWPVGNDYPGTDEGRRKAFEWLGYLLEHGASTHPDDLRVIRIKTWVIEMNEED